MINSLKLLPLPSGKTKRLNELFGTGISSIYESENYNRVVLFVVKNIKPPYVNENFVRMYIYT